MCIRDSVVIGYDSFDSGDDKLIFYLGFQLFQMRLQIRRGSDEDQCIRFFHNIVDVGTESDAVSYTHLDVYKRQPVTTIGISPSFFTFCSNSHAPGIGFASGYELNKTLFS